MDQHSPTDNDPAYELVESYGFFKLVRARASGRYYVAWYDAENRQTRRTSLRTNKPSDAHEKMRFLADLGIDGDPKEYLNRKQVKTVAELLDYDWEKYLHKIPSAEAAGIARDILTREMGEKRLAALVPDDYEAFRDKLKAAGKKIGYVSRILSVLRSAGNRAHANKQTTVKLKVPEYQPRSKKKGLKKKGPLLSCKEIAAIIDELNDQHLLLLMILLIHFGARVGALLDMIKAQIDLEQNLIDLNPPGRETTNKGRPELPIPVTLRPWLEDLPDGRSSRIAVLRSRRPTPASTAPSSAPRSARRPTPIRSGTACRDTCANGGSTSKRSGSISDTATTIPTPRPR